MMAFIQEHRELLFLCGGSLFAIAALTLRLGLVIIREDQAGLVVRKFGLPLSQGRLVAVDGEAGYQATLLPPGWHFPLWRWSVRVEKVALTTVRPGEIALVVANDGAPIPAGRVLAREVACDNFQDAAAFLRQGGERGRQLAILRGGSYRINPALFQVITAANCNKHGMPPSDLRIFELEPERVGIVTTLDGAPISAGDLAGMPAAGHDSFQSAQRFIDAGGCRGLQEEVLLSGTWNLNPWFARVEPIAMTEIPIGYVGVVVSYVGMKHVDVSGESFKHGDLVEKGRKGVWVTPLLPGKHPINTRIMKVELVPTTNIVLNWAARTEAHKYDERLSAITVRSKDGFSFSLDVSQIIHIGMNNAPRVISRVGSMQNLVDHVLQPTVANYFRNSAQEVTVLEFLGARSERQKEAFKAIKAAIDAYDVECLDTLIGDIVPPAELMKTQTDRKIAEEMQRTFDMQRQAQVKRQELERETAIANMQGEVVRSEQMVRITSRQAEAVAETAKGEGQATRLRALAEADALKARAESEAAAMRLRGEAEAASTRSVGEAKAAAYRAGIDAMGQGPYAALQLAGTLGEHHVKLVPDIAVSGDGQHGLASVLVARMLAAGLPPATKE